MKRGFILFLIICATTFLHAETFVYNMVDYNAPSMTTTDGNFALKAAKSNGVTPPQTGAIDKYGEKDLRYYAGNTLEISNLKNQKIIKITFHISRNGHASLTELSVSNGQMDEEPEYLSPNGYLEWEYSWSGNATNVTFTIGEKCKFGYECTENDRIDAGTLFFKKLTIETKSETAVENVELNNAIFAENGRIFCNENAQIFTITGLDVTQQNGNLKGIYVVKSGDNLQKIVVK